MARTHLRRNCAKAAVFACLTAFACPGQDQIGNTKAPDHPDTAPNREFNERNPRYRLGRGDVLEITFPRTPEFNQTPTVQPDGFLNLRGAGDVKVLGMTVPEAVEAVKKAYATVLHEPLITVELKDYEKPFFVAFGQIAKPGKYELRGELTLTQAIAISGGFREGAKNTEVLLLRRYSPELTEVKRVSVKEMLKTGDLHEDPFIMPGDIVFIPKSFMGKIDRFIPNATVGAMIPIY
jgi:polysaccharide export outer membrane protein